MNATAYETRTHPENIVKETEITSRRKRFAVVGETSADASRNIVLDEYPKGDVEFGPKTVVWLVRGNSMEPLAREGQHIFVDRDLPVHDGDLVIVGLKDGRTMFKRFWAGDGKTIVLESANTGGGHRPLPFKRRDVAWMSKVVGVKF